MHRIIWIFAFSLSSCAGQIVSGTYNNVVSASKKQTVSLKTTLVLRDDSSYSYGIENDVTPLVVNYGVWTIHKGTIRFKSNPSDRHQPDVGVVGMKMLTLDSLVNSELIALSFYMIVQDTSWIIGASVSFDSTKLTTGLDEHPLIIDRRVDHFDFEYLGKKITIQIPKDFNKNSIKYFIDFSQLQGAKLLEKLPFDELKFQNGNLMEGKKILFERRTQ